MNSTRTAFPHVEVHDSFGAKDAEFRHLLASTGMTLREHFAGLAMQGMVSSIHNEEAFDRFRAHAAAQGMTVSQWIARDSFKQADAMLAAGEQTNELERLRAERDALARAALAWWEGELDAQGDEFVRHDTTPEFVTLAIATGVEP